MSLFDYVYLCVYAIIPDSTPFGRDQVSATFHAIFFTFVYLTILIWLAFYWLGLKELPILWKLALYVIPVGYFLFNRYYFLKKDKQKEILKKYTSSKKWKLKLTGLLLIIFCFLFFVISVFIISDSKKQTSLIEIKSIKPLLIEMASN